MASTHERWLGWAVGYQLQARNGFVTYDHMQTLRSK